MFSKTIAVLTVVLGSVALVGQQTPAGHSATAGGEFPAVMRQNVSAGKTPVGTKIEAKLVVATLANGTVIPKDAVLSGEVTESVAKSASDPSRLAIRMDSVQWKDGSAPIKVYLTPWYYPAPTMTPQDLSYGPTDAEHTPGQMHEVVLPDEPFRVVRRALIWCPALPEFQRPAMENAYAVYRRVYPAMKSILD